jgi:hypothetical protein
MSGGQTVPRASVDITIGRVAAPKALIPEAATEDAPASRHSLLFAKR